MVVEAIESVVRQSFDDLEVIVADDGSTDGTAERIAALGGPIRYLYLPHSGFRLGQVRNRALREARGDLIAFLDDDDQWEPEKLARQVALLDSDAEVGLVYTGFSVLTDDGSVHVPELARWQTGRGPLLDRLLRECFIHPSTAVVRRTLLERVNGLDERRSPCEDYDLWLRLAPLTIGACIAEPLVRLRRGATSNSVRDRPERQVEIYDTSIAILEDWLASGRLRARQGLRCRAAISNLHAAAAEDAHETGDGRRARRHARGALLRNPLSRRAWAAVRRSP
jgi:hypothetical protein